jgi:hypothetical protein
MMVVLTGKGEKENFNWMRLSIGYEMQNELLKLREIL